MSKELEEHLGHLDMLDDALGRPIALAGMMVEVAPCLAPDTIEFRCGDRLVARLVNIEAVESNSEAKKEE